MAVGHPVGRGGAGRLWRRAVNILVSFELRVRVRQETARGPPSRGSRGSLWEPRSSKSHYQQVLIGIRISSYAGPPPRLHENRPF